MSFSPADAQLHIRLDPQQQPISVQAHLRLPKITMLLNGCDPAQLQQRLGLIYRQCSEAQRWAAASLFEQHNEQTLDNGTLAARQQALALEWLSEHRWQLWRIAQLLLPEQQHTLQMLMMQWRAQLRTLQQQLSPQRYQYTTKLQPVAFHHQQLALALQTDTWQQQLWLPLEQYLTSKIAPEHHLWSTPATVLQQWESGAMARQFSLVNSQASHSITTWQRLQALWAESLQAANALLEPEQLQPNIDWRKLPAGVIPAARGDLRHHGQWQTDLTTGKLTVTDYQIHIPTSGILTSIEQGLQAQLRLGVWPKDWQHSLPIWLHSHSPCLDLHLVVTEHDPPPTSNTARIV